jgi:hypothetical protein
MMAPVPKTSPNDRIAAWLRADAEGPSLMRADAAQWGLLTEAVSREGLAGLMLDASDRHGVQLPESIRRSWRMEAARIAASRRRQQHATAKAISFLRQAGIEVMLLKGAALAETAYLRPEHRPSGDVDLLVRHDDAARALQALLDQGCRRGQDLTNARFFPDHHYETELFSPTPHRVRIDLHARPLRPMPYSVWLDESEFWKQAQTVRIGSQHALIPSAETMLIHLAAHAAFHGCSRLIWLHDLKRWVDLHVGNLDWAAIEERCARWRVTAAVAGALTRGGELFGPIAPADAMERLKAHRRGWAERRVLAQAPHDAARPASHVITNLMCTPGLHRRVRYATALLMPDRKHLAGVYPYRHTGWRLCAFGWRILRAGLRAAITPIRGIRSVHA